MITQYKLTRGLYVISYHSDEGVRWIFYLVFISIQVRIFSLVNHRLLFSEEKLFRAENPGVLFIFFT